MAETLAIQKHHDEVGPRWIASGIGVLALAGDLASVERFRAIAAE